MEYCRKCKGKGIMSRQKAFRCLFALFLLLCLTGCSRWTVDTQNLAWHQQLSSLLHQSSYTVHIQTTRRGEKRPCKTTDAYFDGTASHMSITEEGAGTQEIYYSRADASCFGYGWEEEQGIWVYQEIDNNDNYFYAYSVIERLQNLGAWIDRGELRFDKSSRTYTGENLSGSYVFDGQTHRILSIEIAIENNRVSSLTECYAVTENGGEQIYSDTVWFEDVGLTQIQLPVNCISAEEIRAATEDADDTAEASGTDIAESLSIEE